MIRRSLFLLVCLALVAGACARGEAAPRTTTTTAPTTTTSRPTTTTTEAPPAAPLTGLPAEDSELLDRRVVAVKVDNHPQARPQSGLQEADAVYELLVEGGLTRFIALFHTADSTYVGPMRSGRPTDPNLLGLVGATFAISGAQRWVLGVLADREQPVLGEGPGTFRIGSRRAPHNLYADTATLREVADERGYRDDPPPDLFGWGELPPPAEEAERIAFDWSPGNTVVWEWDGERYLRFNGDVPHQWTDADGERGQLTADTLVVLFAERYTATPPAGAGGSPVPSMRTLGEGRALVFSGGRVAEGTWERESPDELFALRGADGQVLPVPAGQVLPVPAGIPWVLIFPDDREVSW